MSELITADGSPPLPPPFSQDTSSATCGRGHICLQNRPAPLEIKDAGHFPQVTADGSLWRQCDSPVFWAARADLSEVARVSEFENHSDTGGEFCLPQISCLLYTVLLGKCHFGDFSI